MYYLVVVYLAAVAAGLALLFVLGSTAAAFLGAGLIGLLNGLAVIVVIVFSLLIVYLAVKALFHKNHW
ncbi:hypothetical protein D3H55_01855 [Bacillus salacetis]|uniref:Uncharacterized protein n=1 Tax=Bacillus salacetis TaxID=2315464 RepID=A0A3A1R5J5_9BACI|nr:hypothetical protein [Bacillus salacetis]RIW38310.1 hypothetical protein D3H55_01855 [Bacillus salacetis]